MAVEDEAGQGLSDSRTLTQQPISFFGIESIPEAEHMLLVQASKDAPNLLGVRSFRSFHVVTRFPLYHFRLAQAEPREERRRRKIGLPLQNQGAGPAEGPFNGPST